jgi:hypothetical protein
MQKHSSGRSSNSPVDDLFEEIVRFLKHRPHSAIVTCNEVFLTHCVLGKGELSLHFILLAHLARDERYLVIGQHPLEGCRDTVDLLVADAKTLSPLAVVELKHHSVHQGRGAAALLSGKKHSLDADLQKRSRQKLGWGNTRYSVGPSRNIRKIPLIQIGLLTAILRSDHPVHFVSKYVKGRQGQLEDNSAVNAKRNYHGAENDINSWWKKSRSGYSRRAYGWGPDEMFKVPGASQKRIHGRVGFICVLSK